MQNYTAEALRCASTYGEGSRFTIILPWLMDTILTVPGLKLGDKGCLKKVLIIEDNNLDIEHITGCLKEIGIESAVQSDVYGALEHAATLYPDAILLDLNLPNGFGQDLLAQLKSDKRTRNIPVIISSVKEQRTEAMKLGAIGYLLKPFGQQDLRTELAKAGSLSHSSNPKYIA